ncbi:MAG: addiction module toxin, HicA family [Bacteroidales bacterium]|jgi:predicted RNA binding protein YcfA (HicA-like mRNA interferase family)|nr:type II toxin-antitoxin system HicA family toxin [Paludibacter sp.]NLO49675.1 addiction module toxin, HicA family [Bacteroidales bacterium]
MSRTYPKLTGKPLIKILSVHGFEVSRIHGSHHFLKHNDGRRTVVPVHGSEMIGPGLLKKILRDVDLEISQL